MSLSVERVRRMLEVAKKERAESWDDMDEVNKSFSNDCVSAFEELLAIKETKPVAYGMPNSAITGAPHALMLVSLDVPSNDQYGGALWVPLIRKPE